MRILDLFCGAGGASMGMHYSIPDAEIYGVDIEYQPRYPFIFIQGDAFEVGYDLGPRFDVIWASPPCQAYSLASSHLAKESPNKYPNLIAATRKMLRTLSKPYIIENVQGAPLHHKATLLCGLMFPELGVIRHRLFETNPRIAQPPHPYCRNKRDNKKYYTIAGKHHGRLREWQDAMQIPWMLKEELAEAIPPAYSQYILTQLLHKVAQRRERSDRRLG